jgi:hypothetical protein
LEDALDGIPVFLQKSAEVIERRGCASFWWGQVQKMTGNGTRAGGSKSECGKDDEMK